MPGTWEVTKADLEARKLLDLLIRKDNPVSVHVSKMIAGPFKSSLQEYEKTRLLDDALVRRLVDEINRIIGGSSIYDPTAFEHAYLTDIALEISRHTKCTKDELREFNRLLLAEAYPCAISTGIPPRTPEWHKWQVQKFTKLRPLYKHYCDKLWSILEDACKELAPLAIVQARPKEVSSFSEKAWRKEKYINPICQITDLCGARVITETQEEVERICEFVRERFVIDEVNSVDKRNELKCDEFGYLAIHYVVRLKPQDLRRISKAKSYVVRDLKAEIQVKTILQHAWSSISHDRIYKTQFDVPAGLKRNLHRVAALLEDADNAFEQAISDLQRFKCYYGAYMTPEEMTRDIRSLHTSMSTEPDVCEQAKIALQIALLYKAKWDWQSVKEILDPFIGVECKSTADVLAEHGHALCWMNRRRANRTEEEAYDNGQQELIKATQSERIETRLQALTYLGWSFGNIGGKSKDASDAFKEALAIDPSDPYVLSSYLEYEMSLAVGHFDPAYIRPMLLEGLRTCAGHAEAGIELPWAYLTMGRFYLLVGDLTSSFTAYAAGIQQCIGDNLIPIDVLGSERDFLHSINRGRHLPDEHRWIDEMFMLAQAVKANDATELLAYAQEHMQKEEPERVVEDVPELGALLPIVIVSGGAAHKDFKGKEHAYRLCFEEAFKGFNGRIISGGTRAGIPGLVGELADKLGAKTTPNLEVTAYRPVRLPSDAPEDRRYTGKRLSRIDRFCLGNPLDVWFDLVTAGVKPSEVRVLGVNGGPISLVEYVLALALGATVGIIQGSGRVASDLEAREGWFRPGSLIWLPLEDASLRAFANPGQPAPDVDWTKVGMKIHEHYVEKHKHDGPDLSMRPWPKLRPDLWESNIEQAKNCVEILSRSGFRVRTFTGAPSVTFTDAQIEEMARLEHGRWIVERLKAGWRYGPVKNTEKKINPCLVPWEELPETIRQYDYEAVREWPSILAAADLEVY